VEGTNLPAEIRLNDPEGAYDLWVLWHSLEKRFLPSQLKDEPEADLQDVMTIEAAYQAVKEAHDHQDN
jgi:hypothetical protein